MGKRFIKFYIIFAAVLTLLASASLIMLNSFLNKYETEQEMTEKAAEYERIHSAASGFPETVEVMVEKYRYSITVPAAFELSSDDAALEIVRDEAASDGETSAYFITAVGSNFSLSLTDAYGHEVIWKFGEHLPVKTYSVTVPENFKVSSEYFDTSAYITDRFENPDYRWANEYMSMPMQVTYTFADALYRPDISITDNLGNTEKCDFSEDEVVISAQCGTDEIPGYIFSKEEALFFAKQWSLFMTDDIWRYNLETWDFETMNADNVSQSSPYGHGIAIIRKYLLKDSYLYDVATKWAYGVDIGLTSRHVLAPPFFTDEKVDNFVLYGEDAFSVNVYFTKKMLIGNTRRKQNDVSEFIIYFVLNGEFDGSYGSHEWVMADVMANVKNE